MRTLSSRQSRSILVVLASGMALQMTAFAMLVPLFARRFESFGAGVQALAVCDMAYALTATAAAPFVGMLTDRFGRRPIILVSLAGNVLAFCGYLFAPSALAGFRIPETYTPAAQRSRAPFAWSLGWQALPARSPFFLLMPITFGVMFAWAFIEPQFMFYG
jgi:MFS family permease